MRSIATWFSIVLLGAAPVRASDCSRTSTGLKPLTAPFFGAYQGMPGGLYPNGSNRRPDAHEAAGQALLAQVQPLSPTGELDPQRGRVVLLSIGMSNATQEFSAFQLLANQDRQKNAKVAIVDGAQGGWSADRIVADPATYWSGVAERLSAAGVTAAQVQAAWLKDADASPTLSFPASAQKLESELKAIVQMAKARYPNLVLLYHSSRIYAGYATTNLNPEPFAYQGGFAVKWLVEAQIAGDPDLSYPAKVPWMAWGPYLWADGMNMRTDGLTWACADLEDDGTHPSTSGRLKVAGMLLNFFKSDSTTRPWFVGVPAQPPPAPVPEAAVNAASYIATIAPGAMASIFGTNLAATFAQAPSLPLPYGLEGTGVSVGGEPAPLLAVSPGQINFIVPPTANGNSVVVVREGVSSMPLASQTGLYTEGLFTVDASGVGPVAALHRDGSLVTALNPAHHGETIELYGTGKGVRNPAILAPELLPIVHIGPSTAVPAFYGPAPFYPGLDQINVTVPINAPFGQNVPLNVQLGSFTSNTATIAIAEQ